MCDKEGHSWVTCSDRKGGSSCARCGSSAHYIKSYPQRSSERVNSHQTDDSDPLIYMIEIKVMEVAGAPTGAKLLYYPLQIRQARVKALLDSGASVNCIDADLVRSVDGCLAAKPPGNLLYPDKRKAIVKRTTELEVRGPGYREKVSFWVVQGLGVFVLLGAPWLRMWNPTINWQTRELTFSDGVRWKADKAEEKAAIQKIDTRIGLGEQLRAVGLCAHLRQPEVTDECLITIVPDDPIVLPDWLKPFRVVFDEPTKIDREGRVKHKIRLQEGAVLSNRKPYRMSIEQKQALTKELSKFIGREWIRPFYSEWAILALVVPKKDGTMRVCIDYRDLNAVSLLDAYPLPRIDELLNKLANARWYTKVDLASGYHLIPMEEDSIKYTGFRVGDPVEGCSFFEWVVMPMGLASAPATFQRWMEWALQGLENFILIYLDDVLIYSLTKEQHHKDVEAVMNRFKEKEMKVKWEKCEFAKERVKFLGYQVQGGKIIIEKDKLMLLKAWIPPLKTVKQVRQFMGFLSYYHAFVPNFFTLTAPLTELLKGKQTEIVWTEAATEAVNKTKQALLDACQ